MTVSISGIDGSGKDTLADRIENQHSLLPVIRFPSCKGSKNKFISRLGSKIKDFLDSYQQYHDNPNKFLVAFGNIILMIPCFIARRTAQDDAILIRDPAIDCPVYGGYYLPHLEKSIRGVSEVLFGSPERIIYLVSRPNNHRQCKHQIHHPDLHEIYQRYGRELARYSHERILTERKTPDAIFEEFKNLIHL